MCGAPRPASARTCTSTRCHAHATNRQTKWAHKNISKSTHTNTNTHTQQCPVAHAHTPRTPRPRAGASRRPAVSRAPSAPDTARAHAPARLRDSGGHGHRVTHQRVTLSYRGVTRHTLARANDSAQRAFALLLTVCVHTGRHTYARNTHTRIHRCARTRTRTNIRTRQPPHAPRTHHHGPVGVNGRHAAAAARSRWREGALLQLLVLLPPSRRSTS